MLMRNSLLSKSAVTDLILNFDGKKYMRIPEYVQEESRWIYE